MSLESSLFSRFAPDEDRLYAYGFQKEGEELVYRQLFLDGAFEAQLFVCTDAPGKVRGRVIDTSSGEEYTPLYAPGRNGPYVTKVRESYLKILQEIAGKCFTRLPFACAQANRIAALVRSRYQDEVDYPFEKQEEGGVFRNPRNHKWYGVVLSCRISQLTRQKPKKGQEDALVHILNVKIDPEHREDLLQEPGIYPAYHMSHKNWVSLVLDETLSDERIMQLLEISHAYSLKGTDIRRGTGSVVENSWITPANPRQYDIETPLQKYHAILWDQLRSIQQGSTVYLYETLPAGCVRFRTVAEQTDLSLEEAAKAAADYGDRSLEQQLETMSQPERQKASSHPWMKLKLVQVYPADFLTREKMVSLGVTNVRGIRRVTPQFQEAADRYPAV